MLLLFQDSLQSRISFPVIKSYTNTHFRVLFQNSEFISEFLEMNSH